MTVGIQMFLKDTENMLIVLGALVLGAVLGEWLKIEDWLKNFGIWIEKRISGGSESTSGRFVRGFLAASVLYCTGPMAVLGSISDGLSGDYLTLSIKSVLDGLLSIAFSSALGIGVAFSALPVFSYQGMITLLAAQLNAIVSPSMMNEMTATGENFADRDRHQQYAGTEENSRRQRHPGAGHRAGDRILLGSNRKIVF